MEQNEMQLFCEGELIAYRVQDGIFERRNGGEWISGGVTAERVYLDTTDVARVCHLEFLWKEQIMDLHFDVRPAEGARINTYFARLNE
jgi:hypothetical protein